MSDSTPVHPAPLISIALCTFNGAQFLCEQMDCLLEQDYPNLEIIAVDDGSTDNTLAILHDYAQRDARVQVHQNASNLGYRCNFVKAFRLCRGNFIAPCDQDDIWSHNKLSKLHALIGNHPMSFSNSELVDEQGNPLNRSMADHRHLADISDPATFAFANCVSGHAMLFTKQVLTAALPFPPNLFHDEWLAFTATTLGTIKYCPQTLVKYRQHNSAVTNITGQRHVSPKRLPPYKGMKRLKQQENRIATLANHPARHPGQRPLHWLLKLWRSQYRRWICPALTLYLLWHRHRFFAYMPGGEIPKIKRAYRHYFGLPAKRFSNKGRTHQ